MKQLWFGLSCVVLFLSGCGEDKTSGAAGCTLEVEVAVIDAAADEVLFAEQSLCLEDGATAYDALKATKLDVEASGAGEMVYVQGIEGVREKSAGQMSGWVYAYNGEPGLVGAASQAVKSGDVVEWRFEEDAAAFFE